MARRRCIVLAMTVAMAVAMAGESTTTREQDEIKDRQLQRNRESHIISRLGGPKYQLGSEELDGVCTSLDGPRCDPDEKARHLAQERARIAGTNSRPDGSRSTTGTRVKTVQEFKFENGKEVRKSVEKTLHSDDSEPLVIFKTISAGEDLNKVISQVQAEISDALKELDGDTAGRESKTSKSKVQNEHQHQTQEKSVSKQTDQKDQRDLDTVRECGQHKTLAESSLNHATEEHINICKHNRKLYRCTKTDGNALANDRIGLLKESCLDPTFSAKECDEGERLCELTSPSSFSQFSSPEPCTFEYKQGFVPDDPRQDIFIAEMTWEQARDWCNRHDLCAAFTFANKLSTPSTPVTVWFKKITYTDPRGRGWHTFVKKCPDPTARRFDYLKTLKPQALAWLRHELLDQIAFVDRLLEATPYRNGNDHEKTRQRLEKDFALSRIKAKHRQIVDKAQLSNSEDTDEDKMYGIISLDADDIASWEDAYNLIKDVLAKKGIGKSDKEIKTLATHLWQSISSLEGNEFEDDAASFQVGQSVTARWKGGDWFPGKIERVNEDGKTYAIQFNDGDFDESVPVQDIKVAGGGKKSNPDGEKDRGGGRSVDKKEMKLTTSADARSMIKALQNLNPTGGVKRILQALEASLNATYTSKPK